MRAEQLEDIREYARRMLPSPGTAVSRDTYIVWVRNYAYEQHGDGADVRMHAERTARYLWERRAALADG